MSKMVICPNCQKETLYSPENPHRPFCSERCKIIDLGDWADEKYSIPTQDSAPLDEDEEDGQACSAWPDMKQKI